MHAQAGVEVRVLAADLGRADAPQAIVDELARDGLTIDVLVNNAGLRRAGSGRRARPAARQMEMVQVNVAALTRLTRLLLPGMLAPRRGGS